MTAALVAALVLQAPKLQLAAHIRHDLLGADQRALDAHVTARFERCHLAGLDRRVAVRQALPLRLAMALAAFYLHASDRALGPLARPQPHT